MNDAVCIDFLDLLSIGTVEFGLCDISGLMDFFFLFFLGICVIRKLVHLSRWELEIRLCELEVGWAEVIRQTVSFLLVCVFVGRRVGWVGMVRHQMLL